MAVVDSAAARWERGEIVHAQVDFGLAELMPDPDRPSAWTLSVDYVLQSYVDIEDPTRLELPYTVWLARLVDFHWPAGRPISAVHVGGGGFSVPRYLAVTRPGSTQTVFDPDARLVESLQENLDTDLRAIHLTPELARTINGVADELAGTHHAALIASPDAVLHELLAAKHAQPNLP